MTLFDAPARGTILTLAASKVARSAQKWMRTLHVLNALRHGSDVEIMDSTDEDGGLEKCPVPSSAEVHIAHVVVAGAMETFCAMFDVVLAYLLDII